MSMSSQPLPPLADHRDASSSQHLIVFYVRQQSYALPLDCVQEIVPVPELITLPACPEIVEGFLRLEGEALAVLRLDRMLGFEPATNHLFTPLLVLKGLDPRIALLVDRVHCVKEIANKTIVSVSDSSSVNDCARGVTDIDGRMTIVLDHQRLLLEQEQERLRSLQSTALRRIEQLEDVSE